MSPIFTVYRKELKDILRDRRTIISMLVVPMVAMPLMTLGFGGVSATLVKSALAQVPEVMMLGAENSPKIRAALSADRRIKLVPASADYAARISNKSLRAAVELPGDFDRRIEQAEESVSVRIYHYQGEMRSGFAADAIERAIRDYRDQVLRNRLAARSLPASFARPVETVLQNVAPPEKVGGTIIGMLLPYVIILLSLTGAMYPALDLTAGEKERGTLETILSSPASRTHLVLGKFLVVLTVSLVTAMCSLLSMTTIYLMSRGIFGLAMKGRFSLGAFAVAPGSVLAVLVMLVPLAVLFSAVLLMLGTFARSFKEAQSYAGPLILIAILPAVAGLLPGVELSPKLALVPILSLSLVSKEIFTGAFPWGYIGLVFASTCLYAAIALWYAARMFNRESVLFRT
jgi:sodium transport system permease protein